MTLASLALALLLGTGLPGAGLPGTWTPPVDPLVVVEPFRPAATPWGPGHRGVDLAAPRGAPVRAAAAGVVRFAGPLAGRPLVSIEHPDSLWGHSGWRTTYEAVTPAVTAGMRVRRGQVIGHVAGGGHCTCLHWGLRRGASYADPLALLTRGVVLKPLVTSR